MKKATATTKILVVGEGFMYIADIKSDTDADIERYLNRSAVCKPLEDRAKRPKSKVKN